MSEPLCVARVGLSDDRIDQLLRGHGATTAAVLTALNSRSQPSMPAKNEAAQSCLEARLQALGIRHLEAEGRGQDGAWPTERGLCCLDLHLDTAFELARARPERLSLARDRHAPIHRADALIA
ncbi:DUF3293 domain-containing protein [Sedimentimonas flavescens]|uniref:DUF3293 domain-containing protein n=1 Tax=Sedimentimonas flavescens TaxID=2851012 RepID=UPI001C49EC99|nr:DUF3293 domain-containing protein [Sedimentimonas flavescens]